MENETLEMEVVGGNQLEQLQRAEIDVQIATAKKYPRSLDRFRKSAIAYATADEETAESCIYNRPVGKDGGKQVFAEGMSVRMAEIIAACYENLRIGAMILKQSEREVVARGVAHDLQSNVFSASECIEVTVDKYGKPYSERQRALMAKVALAKARRDAIFQVVPRAICRPVESAVKGLLSGKGNIQTMEKRRARVILWCRSIGVPPPKVFATLGIKGEGDIGVDELEKLNGMKTAIQDGELTVDEAFPEPKANLTEPTQSEPQQTNPNGAAAETRPIPNGEAIAAPSSPQEQLCAFVEELGCTINEFNAFALDGRHIQMEADSWDSVPADVAARMLRAKKGLTTGLQTAKARKEGK